MWWIVSEFRWILLGVVCYVRDKVLGFVRGFVVPCLHVSCLPQANPPLAAIPHRCAFASTSNKAGSLAGTLTALLGWRPFVTAELSCHSLRVSTHPHTPKRSVPTCGYHPLLAPLRILLHLCSIQGRFADVACGIRAPHLRPPRAAQDRSSSGRNRSSGGGGYDEGATETGAKRRHRGERKSRE